MGSYSLVDSHRKTCTVTEQSSSYNQFGNNLATLTDCHQDVRECVHCTARELYSQLLTAWITGAHTFAICRRPIGQYPPWPTRRRQSSAIGVLLLCINIVARTELTHQENSRGSWIVPKMFPSFIFVCPFCYSQFTLLYVHWRRLLLLVLKSESFLCFFRCAFTHLLRTVPSNLSLMSAWHILFADDRTVHCFIRPRLCTSSTHRLAIAQKEQKISQHAANIDTLFMLRCY